MDMLEIEPHKPNKRPRRPTTANSRSETSSKPRTFNIVFVKEPDEDTDTSSTSDDGSDEDYIPSESGDSDNSSDEGSDDDNSSVSSVCTDDLSSDLEDEETKQKINEAIKGDWYLKKLTKDYSKSKSKHTAGIISVYKEHIRKIVLKDRAKSIKLENRYVNIFKKHLTKAKRPTQNDLRYFKKHCTKDNKQDLVKKLKEVKTISVVTKPYRIQLIESNLPLHFKAQALHKVDSLYQMDPSNGEYFKIKGWVDGFMKIPFGKYVHMPVNMTNGPKKCFEYMEKTKTILDEAVYGLNDTKMQIMQLIGQLVSNPDAIGTSIAIHGDKGIGKTSIVKDGISKILNRPFAFIPLGGATDSSYLEGHSYTYEGSTCGKIVQILMDCKVMNPVIYFDELDKISDTPKGAEITNILLHLTDTTQNSEFHDKYFSDLHFDVSKCIFIFSYNDDTHINPVLKDRMYTIHAKGYTKIEKIEIAKKYLIKKIAVQVNFSEDDIYFSDNVLGHIIDAYCGTEVGVRTLKRCIETIYTKLNLCRLMQPGTKMFDKNTIIELSLPCSVTTAIVDNLLKSSKPILNSAAQMMYI